MLGEGPKLKAIPMGEVVGGLAGVRLVMLGLDTGLVTRGLCNRGRNGRWRVSGR